MKISRMILVSIILFVAAVIPTVSCGGGGSSGNSDSETNIVIDGKASDWSKIEPLVSISNQTVKSLKTVSDSEYIYFCVEGSGLGAYYDLYIDSDNNLLTGIPEYNSGADYLLEGESLLKYSGTNGSWDWTEMASGSMSLAANENVVEIAVKISAFAAIGTPIRFHYTDIDADWNYQCQVPLTGSCLFAVKGLTANPGIEPEPKGIPGEMYGVPYAIGSAIDDLGWRNWDNKLATDSYQNVVSQKAKIENYQTVINVAKNVGTRVMTAWIMMDYDKSNICSKPAYNTPVADYDMTSDGLSFTNTVTADEEAMIALVKTNTANVEFGLHGVSHEHFKGGVEERAEYAHIDYDYPNTTESWGTADMTNKATCYQELIRQYFTADELSFPQAFVPPAHAYYYREGAADTTGAILHSFGIKYANGGIGVSTPVTSGFFIDNGVLFIDRAYGCNYDWVGCTPWYGDWNNFSAPLYPDDHYGWVEAHFPNYWTAETAWTDYLNGLNNSRLRFLPKNTAQCSWQFLYHKFATISGSSGNYTIDTTGMIDDAYTWDLLGSVVIKTALGGKEISSLSISNGASLLGIWKDGFGNGYLMIGKNGNTMGRLDKGTYTVMYTLGDTALAAFIEMGKATYNVHSFSSNATSASATVEMFGTQDVKIKLPFTPSSVISDNATLTVNGFSYANGYLTANVTGKNMNGEVGTLTISE